MPSRGNYRVANREEGKRVERDQSYRSCISTLIVFFFLSLILIACLPWKKSYDERESKSSGTVEQQFGYRDASTARPMESTVEILLEAEEDFGKSREIFERYSNNVSSAPITEDSEAVSDGTRKNNVTGTEENSDTTLSTPFASSTSLYDANAATTTKEATKSPEDSTAAITDTITTESTINDTANVSLSTSAAEEYSMNEIIATTTATTVAAEIEFNATELPDASSTATTEETRKTTTFYTYIDTTTTMLPENNETETFVTTTERSKVTVDQPVNEMPKQDICLTGECKQVASRMLFYMNHSADPCEDFYEYACGGFEANPFTIEEDLERAAYQRIATQMRKENRLGIASSFSKYYNSCIAYERMEIAEKIKLAKQSLKRIGQFYTTLNWNESQSNITGLLAKLLLHHSPLLFDVTPDLKDHSSNEFSFTIGPSTHRNPFETDTAEDLCYVSQPDGEFVNSEKLYKEYQLCKNDTKRFVDSIRDALTALRVFDDLKYDYNISQYIQTTVINIDMEIIQKYFANFPSKSKIRESYLMKDYTYVPVKDLVNECKLVNWTLLVTELTGLHVIPDALLQVYFHKELLKGLQSLEEFRRRDAMQLNNALMGLYARNLYHELVLSRHRDAKDHCLRVATNLLIPEASRLYVSSFSENELDRMDRTIHRLFEGLKETLKAEIAEVKWTTEEGRHALANKVNDLILVVPDITTLKSSARELNISKNYFENSINLLRRYRTSIYVDSFTNRRNPEYIWTYYTRPFDAKGLAIYGLNLVAIPFGVIDWSMVYEDRSFEYLNLATLGTVIAREIAHHFDANGIKYQNGTRVPNDSFLDENGLPNSGFEEYINCQTDICYKPPTNMTIPLTGQILSYHVTQLTLNERLSEAVGLKLAHDTLDRLRSNETLLPWIGDRGDIGFDRLFYLAYAQMHCTKSPLTSSYVSLYEDEQLPSRIRVFLSASSNQHLSQAWNCPSGSGIVPSCTCSVFPDLPINDFAVDPE